ncbi:MAG: hypothetical protein HZC01_00140 [Candidatus Kerfeldbacteria bacterium]|nr:hypothetical protein [Candidatus Kerfeldbacteria bacterium]
MDYQTLNERQPNGKFQGIFDEVTDELKLFKIEMDKHKALLNGTGVIDRDQLA